MIHVQQLSRAAAATATAGLVVLGLAGAAQADPPGNNGTVKVTPHGEVDGIPQNTPHVGCVFDLEWYGFDEGDGIVSEVTFESWAPTAVSMTVDGPSRVSVGGDPASGAGTDDGFDGEATYRLGFDGEPHPQQGYHVRLTIHTPGSQGADTKHKMFWVEDCGVEAAPGEDDTDEPGQPAEPGEPGTPGQPAEPGTPATPEQPEEPGTPGSPGNPGDDEESEGDDEAEGPEVPTGPESPVVAGEQGEEPQASSQYEVAGEQAVAPGSGTAAPSQVDAGAPGGALTVAGSHLGALVALAGALLAGAALLLRRTRS